MKELVEITNDYEKESESLENEFKNKLKPDFTEDDTLFLLATFRLASQIHREESRETGRSYLNHPVEVAGYLAEIGMDSIAIAGGLLHDTVESYNERSGMTTEEALEHVREVYKTKLERQSLPKFYLESYFPDVMKLVDVLTRREGEIYYASIDRILTLDPLNRSRALIIKSGGDRRFNIQEMEGFSTQRKLYSLFKNLYIAHEIQRLMIEERGKGLPLEDKLRSSFEDLITFSTLVLLGIRGNIADEYARDTKKGLKLIEIRDEFRNYRERGGFTKITPSSAGSIFDGMVKKYDRIIRKEMNYEDLKQVYWEVYADGLGLDILFTNLRDDLNYLISGFEWEKL